MKFPQLDVDQARRQLELLGYQWGEQVFLRFFYPSDDRRKDSDKGRKSDRFKSEQIEAYQRQGRGVYFVINGGGHKNDDVKSARAVFIEHDHLAKEMQKKLWQTLALPEPTFQIDTGGKSIHSYWVFEQPISIPQWRALQRDLLEFTDGDRSIKNPARVMRLAGAWHLSINGNGSQVYHQTKIISESGQKYSYAELRAIVPEVVPAQPEIPNHSHPNPPSPIVRPSTHSQFPHPPSIDQISLPVPLAVPLESCLAKQSRQLLASGATQGERNSGGAKLARDLIGTYQYLLSIGQSVDGNPRQLLADYGARCSPTLPETEVESIWKSAESSHPTPSCTPSGVETCVRSWYFKNSESSPLARTLPTVVNGIRNSELKDNPKSSIDHCH